MEFLSYDPESAMASQKYDPKTGKTRLFFRYGGKQYNKTLKVDSTRAGERLCSLVEETIQDLDRGRLTMPPDADPVAYLLSGGKLSECPSNKTNTGPKTLADVFDLYRSDPPPHLEASTRKVQEIHFRRVLEVFPSKAVQSFDKSSAQEYVSRRAKQRYRGKPIQRQTIEKELQTLRQAWAWVSTHLPEFTPPTFFLKDLSFPKEKERYPFLSWDQIEQEIARGGLKPDEISELWDCLWLDRQQVREFLGFVREAPTPPFLYPMVCAAAFTGARRSELCRSRRVDWHLDKHIVRFRQKKRDKHKEFSYRDVRLHPNLAEVMRGWFATQPTGRHAFCDGEAEELTVDAATYHFRRAVKGSKWEVVRGWHVLRHSFASNLAQAGKDQRIIDRWMGHSTDVRWRYQHLRPKDEQEAIDVL